LLRVHRCTHLLVSDAIDARYLSGFRSSNVFLLVSAHRNVLCTDFRYESAARDYCRRTAGWELAVIREGDFTFLKDLVPAGAVLAVQSNALTLDQHAGLRRALPRVRTLKLGAAVSALTVAKSLGEARLIRRCARIADRALATTLPCLRVGVTEREVRDTLEGHCRRLGSEGPAFDTIVLFGRRSALPHGVPSGARLRDGDFVLFDFGCTLDGLRSDITRTLVRGRASDEQRRIYAVVLAAQAAGRAAVRAGRAASLVDRRAREIIERAGYGEAFGHATGHGVGYRIHEAPRLSRTSREVLQAGSVVTVEPGIYISKTGGVRIEDMLLVRAGGASLLTHFPRALMEIQP
jgi:Xaa-Pro aminopeptidase